MPKHWTRWGLGPFFAIVVWNLPLDLSSDAHRLAGLMCWIVGWWVFETLPLAATALLGTAMTVALGIAESKEAFAPFAHPLVLLFLGGFFIAKAMSVHGLDRRIALFFLTRDFVAGRPSRLIVTLLVLTACLSMFISNVATTAMMVPIALGILAAIYPRQEVTQGIVLLAIAYSATIGGVATPIGSTPNIIVLAMLDEISGFRITFFEWMSFGVPLAFGVLSFLALLTLRRIPKVQIRSSERAKQTRQMRSEFIALGKMKRGEITTLVAAGTTIFFWTFPSFISILLGREHEWVTALRAHLPEAVAAIVGSSLLFILPASSLKRAFRPTLKWKEATQIDWNSLLLFGGGLSLGTLMFKTGLAKNLGDGLIALSGAGGESAFWLFLGIVVLFAIFLTEMTSNTATANMMIPLVIATSASMLGRRLGGKTGGGADAGGEGAGGAAGGSPLAGDVSAKGESALGAGDVGPATESALGTAREIASQTGASFAGGELAAIAAIGVALACSFAFMMPVSTPPNAIVYGSGKVKISLMIRKGFILNIVSSVAIILLLAWIVRWDLFR